MIKIWNNLYIHYSVLIIALCFVLGDGYNTAGFTLVSVILHEFGHLFTMYILRKKPEKIIVHAFGTVINSENLSCRDMVIIAISGPIFSFILSVVFYFVYLPLFIPNLLIGIINLFPIMPLDGGRSMYYILVKICGRKGGRIVMRLTGILFGIVILIPGLLLFLYSGYNISMLMLGVFVFVTAISFTSTEPVKFVVSKPCLADLYIIPADMKAGDIINWLPQGSIGAVTDDKGIIVKLVTPNGLFYELAKK